MEKITIAREFENGLICITQFKDDTTALLTLKVYDGPNDTIWISFDDLNSLRATLSTFLDRVKYNPIK